MTRSKIVTQLRSCKLAFCAVAVGLLTSLLLPGYAQTQSQVQREKRQQTGKENPAASFLEKLRQNSDGQWSLDKFNTSLRNFSQSSARNAKPGAPGINRADLLAKLRANAGRLGKASTPMHTQALEPPFEVQWASLFTDAGVLITSVAADGNGNSYSVGYSLDVPALVIFKRDGNGVQEWALSVEGAGANEFSLIFAPPQVAADQNGNVYVCGFVIDDALFHSQDNADIELLVPGAPRMFLAKYDTDGNLQWVKSSRDDSGSNAATEIDVDESGGVYISGFFGLFEGGGSGNDPRAW